MKNIKLIIFDLDGTLVDAYPAIIRSFNYTMKKLRLPALGSLTICRAVGHGDENLLRPFVNAKDLKRAVSLYRRHHKIALLKGSRLFPKVKQLLSSLKNKGYKLAVASNRPTTFSWVLIRHLKIGNYFDYVLCADKLKHRKPHPEIINKIRRHFSLTPPEVVYAGDMVIDLQAGRRAKVKTIAVTTGSNTREELKREKPYRIIKSLSCLIPLIK